jgi:hypothetical protein
MDMLWFMVGALTAAVHCLARSVVDLREKRYTWGALGLLSCVVFVTAPVQTHAVKLDIPARTNGS